MLDLSLSKSHVSTSNVSMCDSHITIENSTERALISVFVCVCVCVCACTYSIWMHLGNLEIMCVVMSAYILLPTPVLALSETKEHEEIDIQKSNLFFPFIL